MKRYLILGNINAVHKDTIHLVKRGEMWAGVTNYNTGILFIIDDSCDVYHSIEDGKKLARVASVCWWTNMDNKQRHEELKLTCKYDAGKYRRYDNCDAINVDLVEEIPYDYDGVMGVPITFLGKYCPEQFEIVGKLHSGLIAGEYGYGRLLIRRKR